MGKRSSKKNIPLNLYPFKSLCISDIAGQSYCEKRIDLSLKHINELASIPVQDSNSVLNGIGGGLTSRRIDMVSIPTNANRDTPAVKMHEKSLVHGIRFHESASISDTSIS